MIEFNFDHCEADAVGPDHGITKADWVAHEAAFAKAHETMQTWRRTQDAVFLDMPAHSDMIGSFETKAREVSERFANVVVLGIGGSALGLACLARASLKPHHNLLDRTQRGGAPRLFVCDNIDPESIAGLFEMLDPRETLINVISKSGGTTETMAQFALARTWLMRALGNRWKDHVVASTDPSSGNLRAYVRDHDIAAFDIPPKLGGRFSVLSSVGLFPAACVGIDIAAVIDGAASMARACERADPIENPGYRVGATNVILAGRKGKSVTVMMPYTDRLGLFGDWYAQLWAESLGKKGLGQTVVKSLGATDQHSQLQLFMEGPNDKVITFVGAESFADEGFRIDEPFPSFDYLKGRTLGDILAAELKATANALAEVHRPNMTVTVDRVTPETMGELFVVYEVACAYAGALMGINPFDQPGVELGKKLTKEILSA